MLLIRQYCFIQNSWQPVCACLTVVVSNSLCMYLCMYVCVQGTIFSQYMHITFPPYLRHYCFRQFQKLGIQLYACNTSNIFVQ